jgi:hypothetical protein
MAQLVLGPLLRHIGTVDATIWVETDAACEVEVLGATQRTFQVAGHHYALVCVDGLEPGGSYPYDVRLDGEQVWPVPDSRFPPSTIRTVDPDRPLKLLFGSCRVAHPQHPPYTLSPDEDKRGHGQDSLRALTLKMAQDPPDMWPAAMLCVGDQVYADEVPPETLAMIQERRDTSKPPGEEVANFEEYTWLYREAWSEEVVRWFLSTVSTAMLFDDHDVHDDWNIARSWVDRMRSLDWWDDRIVGAFMSYWIYQHLGNLSPQHLAEDKLYNEVLAADDAADLLRDFAHRSDRTPDGTRWSFSRDFGRVRLLAIDCRAGRVLQRDRRRMVDDEEWAWIVNESRGEFDHLLLGMSDPYILAQGIHDLQAWNEATCMGAWGKPFEHVSERIREAADLDHWASFRTSFEQMTDLLTEIGSGRHCPAPSTIVAMSGDVHNAYLARIAFRKGEGVKSGVYQAVCSPVRNPLPRNQRLIQRVAASRPFAAVARLVASSAGVPRPNIRWRYEAGPSFANQVAALEIDGRSAELVHQCAVEGPGDDPEVATVFRQRLA